MLVVEDNDVNRRILTTMLKRMVSIHLSFLRSFSSCDASVVDGERTAPTYELAVEGRSATCGIVREHT